jgi:hypothetical protein
MYSEKTNTLAVEPNSAINQLRSVGRNLFFNGMTPAKCLYHAADEIRSLKSIYKMKDWHNVYLHINRKTNPQFLYALGQSFEILEHLTKCKIIIKLKD